MIRKWFDHLPLELIAVVEFLKDWSDDNQIHGYVVGGFVRDVLLKKKNLDLDFVFEVDVESLAKKFSSHFKGQVVYHRQFKTATVLLPTGCRIDLTSARKERYPYPGALPVVELGGIRDDLFRRDFTVNAMAVSINAKSFGCLIDFFEGLRDLKNQRVRILHAQSFFDDPTRILRAVRFEQRLGFQIEPETLRCLKQALVGKAFDCLKPPRLFDEFRKVLKEERSERCLLRLHGLKGLRFLDVSDANLKRGISGFKRVAKTVSWLRRDYSRIDFDVGWVYFLSLLAEQPNEAIQGMMKRFAFSRVEQQRIFPLSHLRVAIKAISAERSRPHHVYNALQGFSVSLIVYALTQILKRNHLKKMIVHYLDQHRNFKLAITGNDLMSRGVKASSTIKIILNEVLNQTLDGDIKTRQQQLTIAKSLMLLSNKGVQHV